MKQHTSKIDNGLGKIVSWNSPLSTDGLTGFVRNKTGQLLKI